MEAVVKPDHEQLSAYADLVVGAGVSLRPGQRLLVNAEHDHAPLARAIAS